MWKTVFVVNTEQKAQRIREVLEQEYIFPKIVESGGNFQIQVEEMDLLDAEEIIRGSLS